MMLTVNGQSLETGAMTLAGLMTELGYEGDWYATALNSDVVPDAERATARLRDGDRVEILSPMQGG